MAFSDSMFLIEIVIEELKSYIECKEFYISSKFADVFSLNLKDPNDLDPLIPKMKTTKKKTKVRNVKALTQKIPTEGKLQAGHSILFTSRINTLITTMKNFPIEISLFNKDEPRYKLGSTHVPWSPIYIDYLYKLSAKHNVSPAYLSAGHNVYNETTSERVATVRLNIKLTFLKDKLTSSYRSPTETNQNMYIGFNSKPAILSTIKETPSNIMEDTGIIKTTYSGGKRKKVSNRSKTNKKKTKTATAIKEQKPNVPPVEIQKENLDEKCDEYKCGDTACRISLVKSDTYLDNNKHIEVIKTKSCSSLHRKQFNILNYIFGDTSRPLGNKVFCVGYFTVENNFNKDASSSKGSSGSAHSSESPISSKGRFKFRVCDENCPSKRSENICNESTCSLDLPAEVKEFTTVRKCKEKICGSKSLRNVPTPLDDRIQLDFASLQKHCCGVVKTEKVVGGMRAKMNYEKDCFCSCECTFGFVKHTTYCGICGGYERVGEDLPRTLPSPSFPCPVYHKLLDKNKQKTSASGSDKSKTKKEDDSLKSFKQKPVGSKSPVSGKSPASGKSMNGEFENSNRGKRKRKDDRFKFNYGYTGIPPQIGHSKCVMPCTGTMGAVPKNMGWLWTADDVPGMKFRPMWKPGATHKHVVRLLKMAKNPGIILSKRKKKDTGKKKKPLKRPLLTVAKKDGEYTVTMETMKIYPKTRALNQHPYEDKPVLTYTIGRTEEENRERQKKKERAQRRLERDQRVFIQSAFSDMCKEICLKTYQQALGLLPDAEDPDCPCYPKLPGPDQTDLDHSCSCSEDDASFGTDTDSDEWLVEFTPPNATFDPTYKGKKVFKLDNTTQYNYLDYRVKLLDRFGNQVPRFFKGPNGKTQCSDLGGFWSPDHQWLEINSDGYIGPDGRWAPILFIGPNGEQVDCDTGKFQAMNGSWLVVGVDGYIDPSGKWKFYPKPKQVASPKKKPRAENEKKGAGDKKDDKGPPGKPSETTWSCFGDANPKDLSKLGITGHGQDKKLLLKTLNDMIAQGEDVTIPQPSVVPAVPSSKKGKGKSQDSAEAYDSRTYFSDRNRCKHPVPSEKGIVAVDGHGNKIYFKLKDYKNRKPNERIANLTHQGISLSSFHTPCFNSFINTEMLKKQQYERRMKMAKGNDDGGNNQNASTQYKYYKYIT